MPESDVSRASEARMDADAITALRVQMGMSQEEFGDLLGVSRKTVGNWERGGAVQKTSRRRLSELAATVVLEAPDSREQLTRRVSELESRLDYVERLVLKMRSDDLGGDELAARRRANSGLSPAASTVRESKDVERAAMSYDPTKELEGHEDQP